MHRTRSRMLLALAGPFRGPARRDDAGGTGTSTGSGSTEGGSGGDGQGDTGAEDDSTTGKPNIDGDLDKDRAARSIAAARDGEKKAKAAAKAADERVAAVLKAAGLTPDGKTDPADQLAAAKADADKATQKLRDKSLRLAIRENADKAGVDPAAVIDSSSFKDATAELDPDAADYDDKVVAAMKKALKINPRLAATTAGQGSSGTGRQGADHTGGGTSRTRSGNLTDAVTKKLGGS